MTLLVTLVVVGLAVYAGSNVIKKYSSLLYVLALALSAAYLYFRFFSSYIPGVFSALQVMQKGLIAFALFSIVMFIGVLDESSRLRLRLHPIRAELSLLGFCFALGHIVGYLTSYLTTLIRDSAVVPTPAFVSITISFTSFVLLLILSVTTLSFVRSRMNALVWKRVQRTAYVFFGLVYIHLMLMLVPALRADAVDNIISVAVYTLLFGSYAVLRLLKARRGRSRS